MVIKNEEVFEFLNLVFKQEMANLLSLYTPRYNLDTRYYFSYMKLAFYVYLFRDNVWWFERECPPLRLRYLND